MANLNAPFGFKYAGRIDGMMPNAGLQTRSLITTGTNAAIFYGDPVANNGSGLVIQATAGTNPIDGIFYGCTWQSSSQNKIIHSNYYPLNNADAVAGSATCLICSDPMALFLVQNTAGPWTIADVAHNVQFALGTGNTATGVSGATAGASATTTTYPFKITGLYTTPVGTGGDVTTQFNWAYVTFNNEAMKNPSVTPL